VVAVVDNIDSTEWKQFQVVDNADDDQINILTHNDILKCNFFCQNLIQSTVLLIEKQITLI